MTLIRHILRAVLKEVVMDLIQWLHDFISSNTFQF
jgi:hypothetical protein